MIKHAHEALVERANRIATDGCEGPFDENCHEYPEAVDRWCAPCVLEDLAKALASAPSAPPTSKMRDVIKARAAACRRCGGTGQLEFGTAKGGCACPACIDLHLALYASPAPDQPDPFPPASQEEPTQANSTHGALIESWRGRARDLLTDESIPFERAMPIVDLLQECADALESLSPSETAFAYKREYEAYVELEGRLCPEDVGFEEFIGVLRKKIEALSSSATVTSVVEVERERVLSLMESHAAKYLNASDQIRFREVMDWITVDARNAASSAPVEKPPQLPVGEPLTPDERDVVEGALVYYADWHGVELHSGDREPGFYMEDAGQVARVALAKLRAMLRAPSAPAETQEERADERRAFRAGWVAHKNAVSPVAIDTTASTPSEAWAVYANREAQLSPETPAKETR